MITLFALLLAFKSESQRERQMKIPGIGKGSEPISVQYISTM